MHDRVDARGLRWKSDKKNELFVPKELVEELIAVMRTIPGEEMYLFNEDSIETDDAYLPHMSHEFYIGVSRCVYIMELVEII